MADPDPFDDVWKAAVRVYEDQTQRNTDKDDTFRKFKGLTDLEQHIKEQQNNFASFRSEHGELFSKMAKIFRPLVPILNLVQGGISSSPYAPAAIAFGAASHLLKACELVTKCYDAVEDLFDQIGNITERLQYYGHDGMEASLDAKMTDMLAYILEIMGKTEKVVRRPRFKQWARSVFADDDEISASVEKLQKYVERELGLVVALTYAKVGNVQDSVAEAQKGINEVLKEQRSERLRAFNEEDERRLASALKNDTYAEISTKHSENRDALTKGTGLWIKEDAMFQAWEKENAPILWILGKPGVGKTMLATRTIETLKSKYPQHQDIPSLTSVSYLYFKNDNPKLQDCKELWKSAAWQIAKANDRFKKHALNIIKEDEVLASNSRRVLAFIVVDGLDEAPAEQRTKFLICLTELTKRFTGKTRCRIQVAIFARPDVLADPDFDKIGSYRSGSIVVTPERNSKDIGAFVKQKLGDVEVLKIYRKGKATKKYEALARYIFESVKDRSQGMFLWARLVFDQIRAISSEEAVKASLDQSPSGLDDMLHHVFKRFDTDEQMQQSYLRDLLTWVLCAQRQLYISELFVLLQLTAGQQCVAIKKDLLTRYSSIFNVSGPREDDVNEEEEPAQDAVSEPSDDDFDFLDDGGSESTTGDEDNSSDATDDRSSTGGADDEDDGSVVGASASIISKQWHLNRVTFAHARVIDYLETEFDPKRRRWVDCSIFDHDLNESKVRIVSACIAIMRTEIAYDEGVTNLVWYARSYWVRHLADVDCGEVGGRLSIGIARELADFFNDGVAVLTSSYGVLDFFMGTWFETNKYHSVVRRLITDHMDYLKEQHREWAERVKKSTRALFESLVAECSRRWLTKTGWDDEAYLTKGEVDSWVLYAFNAMGDEGVNEDAAQVFYYEAGSIPLEDIETIAELGSLPKTEHWYAGVAWIMMEANEEAHTRRAIEYFQKAIDMAPGAWVALEGLAVCHGTNLCEYETAVNLMNEAILQLPQTDDYSGVDFHLRSKMGSWQRQLGDPEEAVRVTKRAYMGSLDFSYPTGTAGDHHILLSVRNYIEAMYDAEHLEGILDFIDDLDARITKDEGRSLWIVFLRAQWDDTYDLDLFDKLGLISRSLEEIAQSPSCRAV